MADSSGAAATTSSPTPEPDATPDPSRQRGVAGLAGADADRVLHRDHEDLAVADLAGARGLAQRERDLLGERVRHHHFDPDLRQEVDDVFGAAVELGVSLLPP